MNTDPGALLLVNPGPVCNLGTFRWAVPPGCELDVDMGTSQRQVSLFDVSGAGFAELAPVYVRFTDGVAAETAMTLRTISTAITGPVTVTGTVEALQDGAWTVGAEQVGAWTVEAEQSGTWELEATQGTSPWVTADQADGSPGSTAPTKATQVGGTDGTDLRALLTDATGRLLVEALQDGSWTVQALQDGAWIVTADQGGTWTVEALQDGAWTVSSTQGTSPWVTADQADGSPGSTAPAKATQVGGTDGTDLRALLTDASGRLQIRGDPKTAPGPCRRSKQERGS